MTTPSHAIKRGVSLYSVQEEYFLRTLSLEDCIAAAARVGARGVEIIPEQSIPGFPQLSDEFVDSWFSWMEKYGTTPVATDLLALLLRWGKTDWRRGRLPSREAQPCASRNLSPVRALARASWGLTLLALDRPARVTRHSFRQGPGFTTDKRFSHGRTRTG